jgi:hypothetical protein
VVVRRTRRGEADRLTWAVAALANLTFAIVVVLSLLGVELTTVGDLLHGATLLGALGVLALSLTRLFRPSAGVGSAVRGVS